MTISFDLHGVLSDQPAIFKEIMQSFLNSSNGNDIWIITGSTTKRAHEELEELGFTKYVHFTHVIGLPDYLEEKGAESTGIHPVFKNKEYPQEVWDRAKSEICSDNNISLHFDDTTGYGDTFTTPFARIWTKDRPLKE